MNVYDKQYIETCSQNDLKNIILKLISEVEKISGKEFSLKNSDQKNSVKLNPPIYCGPWVLCNKKVIEHNAWGGYTELKFEDIIYDNKNLSFETKEAAENFVKENLEFFTEKTYVKNILTNRICKVKKFS